MNINHDTVVTPWENKSVPLLTEMAQIRSIVGDMNNSMD